MSVQEIIARGYTVSVSPPANAEDGYHVVYTLRGTQRGWADGLFHAIGNGGGGLQVPAQFEAVARFDGQQIAVRWASAAGQPEALRDEFERDVQNRVRLFGDWFGRLSALVNEVEGWLKELGWSTRRIEKSLEDAQIGKYKVPSLLMQEGVDRILLEPIGRSSPGTEGVVDLYLMPAYDDIATLFFYEGRWNLHSSSSKSAAVATVCEAVSRPLSKETFQEALAELRPQAA